MLKETASAVSFFLLLRLLLFTSIPQSIAKPSPGWNKVALLTAVRNSPCSCPFSVSLIRPLGALNSEPRSGSLLVLPPTKSCPRLWGKWHEVPKGVRLKTAECRELFPLSFAYAQQNAGWNMVVLQRCRLQYSLFRPILPSLHRPLGALGSNPPFHGGAFWCSTNSAYSAVPLRGAIVSMGLRGGAGGHKGRNRNLPWPPCKKGYKETPFSFVYLTPSVTAYAVPAPRRGEPFGALYNPLYNLSGPLMTAPTPHLINFRQ